MRNGKLRQYRMFLERAGHQLFDDPSNCDVVVLWTCAYRSDVRDNSLMEIERYQEDYDVKLVVAGCLPDICPELLDEQFHGTVINWRGDSEKMGEFFGDEGGTLDGILPLYFEDRLCEDAEQYRKENPDKDVTFHDQFIKLLISEGCKYECTYCSERLMFPEYRSFCQEELLETCRSIIEETGSYEIILMADCLGEYGKDTGSSLPDLIWKIANIHPNVKVALNNMNPADFVEYFDQFEELIENEKIRHLNLPIQSASDHVLKLMARAYTVEDIDRVFGLLNDIGFKEFDTHIIAGFPGETEEDFDQTIKCIKKHKPKYVLASKYMESRAMPSYSLPDKVDETTVQGRTERFHAAMQQHGIICNVEGGQIMEERLSRLNKAIART